MGLEFRSAINRFSERHWRISQRRTVYTAQRHIGGGFVTVHGSTNWVLYVSQERNRTPVELIRSAESIAPLELFELESGVGRGNFGYGFIFAIAIPTQTKLSFECPPHHCRHLQETLPNVTKILTVGWRGLEEHFVKMLNQWLGGLQSLLVVSVGDADEIANALKSRLTARSTQRMVMNTFTTGFSNSINSPGSVQQFLSP